MMEIIKVIADMILEHIKDYKLEKYQYQEVQCSLVTRKEENIKFCNQYFDLFFNKKEQNIVQRYCVIILNENTIYQCLSNEYKGQGMWEKKDFIICCKKASEGKCEYVYYLILQEMNIVILITNEFQDYREYCAMRLIRQLILIGLQNNDWLFFHAACISCQEKGVGIIGNKKTGKTTSLFNLLINGEFEFVSNDKIAIKEIDGDIKIISFPISAGVRIGTLNCFQQLRVLNEEIPQDFSPDEFNAILAKKRIVIKECSLV